jgi:DNA-binding NarL/FixJ family response regulator
LPGTTSIRVLVVDDYEPWHGFVSTALGKEPELEIIARVSDGLEAVQQAQELQPDLILLDIGLPTLNGIEAARRIQVVSPSCKILFVSENRSPGIAGEALNTGAGGYVVKSDAAAELLPAIRAIREGKRFISASFTGLDLGEPTDRSDNRQHTKVVTPFPAQKKIRHEVEFYEDDAGFVDGFVRFIEAALTEGNAIIVVTTDSHQASLLQRLTADGLNMPAEIEQGNYIPLEVRKALSSFMVDDSPDPVLFSKVAGDLIVKAAEQARGDHRRVAVCGEGVHTLFVAGNLAATITLERMWNEIGTQYELDILCAYFRSDFANEESISTLERVCAEHSAVYGREWG